jgi:hypothetical protein
MEPLVIIILAVGIVLLLIGVLIGRKLLSRGTASAQLSLTKDLTPRISKPAGKRSPSAASTSQRPTSAPSFDLNPPVVQVQSTVERLEIRLINCFGGDRSAMYRSIEFTRRSSPHLTEVELLEKMLYDFERGR